MRLKLLIKHSLESVFHMVRYDLSMLYCYVKCYLVTYYVLNFIPICINFN